MPQDLKAQLKQFVPPEPTRIESVETLPPALSRTLLEYGYTSLETAIYYGRVAIEYSRNRAGGSLRLQTVLRLVDLGKVAISDKTNKGNTDGDLRRLEDSDYYSDWSARQSPAGWDYEYDIGFTLAWVMLFHAGKLMERQTSSIDQSRTKGAE